MQRPAILQHTGAYCLWENKNKRQISFVESRRFLESASLVKKFTGKVIPGIENIFSFRKVYFSIFAILKSLRFIVMLLMISDI